MKQQSTQCAAVIIWMSEMFAGFTESILYYLTFPKDTWWVWWLDGEEVAYNS